MEAALDLKEIESSAYRAYFEDGMWDLFFGLMFLVGGLRTLFDNAWITLLIIVVVIVPNLGKWLITIPRLGRVSFGKRRLVGRIYMIIVILVAVVASVTILLLSPDGLDGRLMGDAVFSVMVIVVTGAMGYFLEYPRMVIHGIVFAAIMLTSGQYGMETGGYAYLVGACISLTIGLLTLRSFLAKYPPLDMEE
jgi:hypothetical protein